VKQTTVQESRAIRFGSGKVEVGDSLANMVDLGAMRDVMFEETWDIVRVLSDNAGEISVGVRNHRAAIQGNLMEINLEKLHLIRGGIDNYDTEAGTIVEGAEQVITAGNWALGKFILIEYQNHDKSEITINSVEGNSTLYVADTDYTLVQDSAGNWGIIVLDTETTDEDHHLTIDYDYTPAAKKVFSSGGKISIEPRIVRITNTNEEGKEFRITIFAAENENGISLDLPGDEEEDPAMVEVRMNGSCDESRDPGEQLFMIEDFQTV
jgi:hypothetical protein